MLTFGSKLNRSYSMYLPFMDDHYGITIFFSKTNTFLGFKTDSKLQSITRDDNISVNTFKDLKRSLFANTFLDIRDYKGDNLDIRRQFCNIYKKYSETIQYIANESIKLSKITTESGTFESLLYMYGFTFTDYQSDFIYLLVERQHIDTVINKKLVRTSAIQISTKECMDNMQRMIEHYNENDFTKSSPGNYSNDLSDLFPDKTDIKVNKL